MRRLLRPSSAMTARALSSSTTQVNLRSENLNDYLIRSAFNVEPPRTFIQQRFKSALPDTQPETMLTPFLLADIGEGIAEVELLQWYIAPGSRVSQFDRVCQVQSDKASVEITSRYDGVVKELCAEVGGVVKVGEPLCFLETEGGGVTLDNVEEGEKLSVPSVASDFSSVYDDKAKSEHDVSEIDSERTSSSTSAKVLSSPAVRKLGKEHGIDISTVKGSGPNGRVLKADVLGLIHSGGVSLDTNSTSTKTSSIDNNLNDTNPLVSPDDEIIPIRGYHRLMVKSMTSSLSIPHMVYSDEINVTSLQELRSQLKPICAEKEIKLTLLPFFLKAASLALSKYPVVNGSIDMEKMELRLHRQHDLGVAVDTAKGLVVVVVRGCENKSVEEIAVELGRLFSLVSAFNVLLFNSLLSASELIESCTTGCRGKSDRR